MIEVRDLQFSYGKRDYSLEIPVLKVGHGERVAIVGNPGDIAFVYYLLLSIRCSLPSRLNVNNFCLPPWE